MSLHFPYKLTRSPGPVVTLSDRFVRPRPVIPVTLIGPNGSWLNDALLDTGADGTVFPEWIAHRVGIDLANAVTGAAERVVAGTLPLRYAEATIRIASQAEQREWRALVGFTPAPLRRPLLGFAGYLQFFTATFHGDREVVELAVNSLYLGT